MAQRPSDVKRGYTRNLVNVRRDVRKYETHGGKIKSIARLERIFSCREHTRAGMMEPVKLGSSIMEDGEREVCGVEEEI